MDRRTVLTGLVAAPLAAAGAAPPAARAAGADARPGAGSSLVLGHRGASGYRPEHTLASYELAARLGADFMEPDLVATSDGVLVCRHEPEISGTTDVAQHPEFASRRTTKLLDGTATTGWFTEDFTLAELKTLRAVERLPAIRQRNTLYDGLFEVPTLTELLDLRSRLSRELRREFGVIPETKHPTYFQRAGLALEPRLLAALRRYGLNTAGAPVVVQSFETANLRQLRRIGLRTRIVQLLSASGAPFDFVASGDPRTYADLATPAGLVGIARYAQWIGPDKLQVIPRNPDGSSAAPSSLVHDAHAAGLLVTPYTFRAENAFLAAELRRGSVPADYGRGIDEHLMFLAAGVDGVFTDQADVGVLARSRFAARDAAARPAA